MFLPSFSPSLLNSVFSQPDSDNIRRYTFLSRDVDYRLASVIYPLHVHGGSFVGVSPRVKLVSNIDYTPAIYPEFGRMEDSFVMEHCRMPHRLPELIVGRPTRDAAFQSGDGVIVECATQTIG